MKPTTVKKKERQLLQLLARGINQLSEAIIITSPKLEYPHPKILYVNRAFCRLTGYTADQLVGKTPRILQGTKTDQAVLNTMKKTLEETGNFSGSAINYRKDKSEFTMEFSIQALKDQEGEKTHYISVHRDIDAIKEQEKKLQELIGIISHEIKNPLTTVKGLVQFIEQQVMQKKKVNILQYMHTINGELSRINNLLDDLRDTTNAGSTGFDIERSLCDVDAVILQIIRNMRRTSLSHKIIRRGKVKELCYCDGSRVAQVLLNLLSNAIKYSPNANKIILKVKKNSHVVYISVQDFGMGIEKERQTKIFDQFYRATKTNAKISSGIGLYIAATIVRNHGGNIWVQSEKDKGSTFSFTLPLKTTQAPQYQMI